MDEYETRRGGLASPLALCLLAELSYCQHAWGEKDALDLRPQVYRVVREMLPRERSRELLQWLEGTQQRNERASRSHERRRRAAKRIPP